MRYAGFMAFLLSFPLIALMASSPPPDRESRARRLLELSKTKEQIRQVSVAVDRALLQKQPEIDPKTYQRVSTGLKAAFATERMYEHFEKKFGEGLSDGMLDAVTKWYQSPLGVKVASFEARASSPQAAKKMQEMADNFPFNPPTEEEMVFAQQIESRTQGSEVSVAMAMSVTRALTVALTSHLPEAKRVKAADVEQHLEAMRGQIEPSIKNSILISYLYTYKPLSKGEKEKFLQFLSTKEGGAFYSQVRLAMLHALETAAKESAKP